MDLQAFMLKNYTSHYYVLRFSYFGQTHLVCVVLSLQFFKKQQQRCGRWSTIGGQRAVVIDCMSRGDLSLGFCIAAKILWYVP